MFGQRSRSTRKRLEERGTSAPAIVLEISDRGMSVTNGSEGIVANTEVVLKTRLRVEPAGTPAFDVTQRFRYPQLSVPSQGARLTVLFDPDDHDKVIIDRAALPLIAEGALAGLPDGGAMIGSILETARAARAAKPGDPSAVADAVRASLGLPDGPAALMFGQAFGAPEAPDTPQEELIGNLERLAALRDMGALTPEEFAVQKAALLNGAL